jgi:hypothetical protein
LVIIDIHLNHIVCAITLLDKTTGSVYAVTLLLQMRGTRLADARRSAADQNDTTVFAHGDPPITYFSSTINTSALTYLVQIALPSLRQASKQQVVIGNSKPITD